MSKLGWFGVVRGHSRSFLRYKMKHNERSDCLVRINDISVI